MKFEIEIDEEKIKKWVKSSGQLRRWEIQSFVQAELEKRARKIVKDNLDLYPDFEELVQEIMKEIDINHLIRRVIEEKLREKGYD